MKKTYLAAAVASISVMIATPLRADEVHPSSVTLADMKAVSPALEQYTRKALFDGLWSRPDLSPRDRSLVTLAVLIARNQTAALPAYLNLALDSSVKPSEISEMITHLAFYSGWGDALSAVPVV